MNPGVLPYNALFQSKRVILKTSTNSQLKTIKNQGDFICLISFGVIGLLYHKRIFTLKSSHHLFLFQIDGRYLLIISLLHFPTTVTE